MALFASLIIRLFQLIFLAGTVFFSHNKSAETVFWLVFSAKQTVPLSVMSFIKLINGWRAVRKIEMYPKLKAF